MSWHPTDRGTPLEEMVREAAAVASAGPTAAPPLELRPAEWVELLAAAGGDVDLAHRTAAQVAQRRGFRGVVHPSA
jgi:hypothetical protein